MKITTTKIKPFVSYVRLAGVVLCGTILLFSCSKDNGPGEEPDPVKKAELVLTASATEITVAQPVTIEVTADGKGIDADIYINNNKISGTIHTFEVTGTYTAVAKKEGYTDSKEVEITVKAEKKKVATATFSKVTIQDYPTTFKGDYYDRISIINEHIYVIEKENQKFRRYSLTSDKWEDLASENSLYVGIAGYLTSHKEKSDKNVLVYFGGGQKQLKIYYPPEYPDATLRNSWTSEDVIDHGQNGEQGAASDGEYIYFMGNARKENYARWINRYVPNHNLWEEAIGILPESMNSYTQAVSTDKKLFITGESSRKDNVFIVYDLQTQTAESKLVPIDASAKNSTDYNNTLVVYQDYLLYMLPNKKSVATSVNLYVYDLENEQWLENSIKMETDLFSRSSDNASLLLSSSGKIYAAGTKAGDFVLYEVDFKVTEQ